MFLAPEEGASPVTIREIQSRLKAAGAPCATEIETVGSSRNVLLVGDGWVLRFTTEDDAAASADAIATSAVFEVDYDGDTPPIGELEGVFEELGWEAGDEY